LVVLFPFPYFAQVYRKYRRCQPKTLALIVFLWRLPFWQAERANMSFWQLGRCCGWEWAVTGFHSQPNARRLLANDP